MHAAISKRSNWNNVGIISQKDMAITQFAFVGMQLLNPEKVGIKGSREQLENFSHFWRVLGSLLGIEDRFNLCGETLDETLSRCNAIKKILLPNFVDLKPNAEEYLRIAIEGMKGFLPMMHTEAQLFTVKRFIGVPTYHYFDNEATCADVNDRAFDKLNFYTRLRITIDVVIFKHLSQVWFFRWVFNIFRFAFSVFDHFPIFAIAKFGRKHAYVQIMKSDFLKDK